MAITDAQKVDLLYKKIGFGVAKTDTSAFKSPSNEANASPLLTRGDTIWVESGSIPASKPAANTAVIRLYEQSLSSHIECTLDTTVSGTNRTWLTNYNDWISAEFGPSYQVKVYAAPAGNSSPETYGTQLFADGSGNSDSWYFDYQAGILNFADTNVPSTVTGKKIYVIGARYVGLKGVGTLANLNIGNLSVDSVTVNSAAILSGYLTNIANISTAVANIASGNITANFIGNIQGTFGSFTGNVNSNWYIGNINGTNINASGNSFFNANLTVSNNLISNGNLIATGNVVTQKITSPTGDLHFSAATDNPNNIIRFDSVSAFDIPSGTTAQRPPSPDYGYVRYNTDIGAIEWWSGSSWISGANLIVSENITPDGTSAVYTLGQTTTENAILVNINGTIQQAGSGAYSVTGNQITFSETPLVTDIIEIRYIAGGVAALTTNFANIASNVSPSANVTYDLGSSNYRWRDLWLSGNTINLGSASLSAVGNTIQLPAGSTIGGDSVNVAAINSNVATIQANIGAYQIYANTKIGTNTNSNLVVVSTTPSASTVTGALVVSGGVGIAGNINVGGNIQVGNIQVGATDFYGSLTQNGWQRFPGGMIMQWGRFSPMGATSFYLTFPKQFTTSCFSVTATTQTDSPTDTGGIPTEVALRTSPNVNGVSFSTVSAQYIIHWMATGF